MPEFDEELLVRAKDVVGGSLPVIVSSQNHAGEFAEGTTFGRLIRLRRGDSNTVFFDIGIDRDGNLFVNSNLVDDANQHLLVLTPDGNLRVRGSITKTG